MRQFLLSLILYATIPSYGQRALQGQLLSFVDSTPLAHFPFRVDGKKLMKTDSSGFFSIETHKRKVRLSTIFQFWGFDTVVHYRKVEGLRLYSVQRYDTKLAEYDIHRSKIRLFCGVGYAPLALMPYDDEFERTYQVSYSIVGDFLPVSVVEMAAYNRVIADYLDKRYGIEWRAKARPDIPGVSLKNGD